MNIVLGDFTKTNNKCAGMEIYFKLQVLLLGAKNKQPSFPQISILTTTKTVFTLVIMLLFQLVNAQEKFSKIKIKLPETMAERKAVIAC